MGYLAKAFYDNGVVTHPFVVHHSSRPTMSDWYPGAKYGWPGEVTFKQKLMSHIQGLDVLFLFETPFWWGIVDECRRCGVKTVLMPMYECMPAALPSKPDLIINPSALDQQYFPEGVQMTVPVDPSRWRLRDKPITTFVHNAGHHGLKGRNGTDELIQAWPMVKGVGARLILRTQEQLHPAQTLQLKNCGNVDVRVGNFPYETLFDEGDCFVFSEKFNGLSLPLQEAFAAGMIVAATDRFPNNRWLPAAPLIPVMDHRPQRVGRNTLAFNEAVISIVDIANTLNALVGAELPELSLEGKAWGEANSWARLKGQYIDLLYTLTGKPR